MAQLRVTITARSPLCFSERRPGGQFRYSAGYVPGAVLRGAAAAIMLHEDRERDAVFRQLFGLGQPPTALFRNAYPGTNVLPPTTLSCKDNPGFDQSATRHGVFDTLIARMCFEHLHPPGLLYLPHCPYPGCEPGRVEAFPGFYSVEHDLYQYRRVPQRLLTRVGINRRRMAAEDELLYAPMVLSEAWWKGEEIERASFVGTVGVDDMHADVLAETLHQVTHLGSGTARGLGQVLVRCDREKADSDRARRTQTVKQRLERFNKALQEQWSLVGQLCEGEVPHCPPTFTINLRADAILKEKGWLPTTVLTAEMLREATGLSDPSLRLLRSYSAYDYRGGWNTGQRLPKNTELITKMGSVFVFQANDLERWYESLADLEVNGLGERAAEGFGEVVICDPFHVEGRKPR